MRSDQRIVAKLPLDALWDDTGIVEARRLGELDATQVRELLRSGPL